MECKFDDYWTFFLKNINAQNLNFEIINIIDFLISLQKDILTEKAF